MGVKPMTNALKVAWDAIRDFLGFRRHNSYTRKYLNDANIRSSIYMSFIIFAIEIWMIIRSLNKYVIPLTKEGNSFMEMLFKHTSQYWLFLFAALAMLVFSIYYMVEKTNRAGKRGYTVRSKVIPLIFAIILIIYSFFIFKETKYFKDWSVTYYKVSNVGVILLYFFSFLEGITIAGHCVYKHLKGENNLIFSIVTIVFFSAICLTFGFKVGYTDYFSGFYRGTALPVKAGTVVELGGSYEIKAAYCFLTMVLYVGCLLIWKPYISLITLSATFWTFAAMLNGDPANRVFADGDVVNYITFYISLTIITISIYQQRISEAKKSENLERIAKYDIITEIYNYSHYVREVEKILKEDIENLNEYYYIFINIQNFKTYNDQMGFSEGTIFLKKFATKISEVFNEFPSARESGDHFVAFTKVEGIEEKIKVLEEFIRTDANGLYMNLKVGAVRPIERSEDINTSVDRARYAAGTITNKYGKVFAEYDDKMHDSYKKKQYVINHLDEAIENGYIRPYYQPVVWSKDKKLCGCEALARWIDPKYGFLSPGEFIPTLEDVRLIHKLDKCIFESVCRDIRKVMDEGKTAVPVSINFSRLDFELMDAVAEFESLIEKYNIPKEYVHVEITESALTANQSHLQECIEKLHADGFAIWLDDFGSGYSSLNVLKDFKFDVIKIDMKFLSNFEQKPVSKIILDAIVKLSEKIGMLTLTEGVETKEQADFLSDIGCGRLQGYLFGKPIPLDALIEDIKNGKYTVSDELIGVNHN